MNNPSKNSALITGANKGIGFEIARQLAKAGCTVLLGARNSERGREAAKTLLDEGLDVRFIEIDLAREDTIGTAAETIKAEYNRLDILVNNAGINDPADGPPSDASLDAIERVMQTNFFGVVAVTQAMLPLLRASKSGRIVNVSSGLGSLTLNSAPKCESGSGALLGYCASKAALNMFTIQLARELKDTPIKVNSAAPGFTATDLNNHRGHQTIQQGAAEAIRLALLPDDGPTGGFFDTAGGKPW